MKLSTVVTLWLMLIGTAMLVFQAYGIATHQWEYTFDSRIVDLIVAGVLSALGISTWKGTKHLISLFRQEPECRPASTDKGETKDDN